MLKLSLTLTASLLAYSAFVTTARAGGCHHDFGGGYVRQSHASQSYGNPSPNYYARRKAIADARARANAQAMEKARLLAAKRSAAAKIDVANAETTAPKSDDAATATVKKLEVEKSAPTVVETASATPVCRKFSATVGGLVETACE